MSWVHQKTRFIIGLSFVLAACGGGGGGSDGSNVVVPPPAPEPEALITFSALSPTDSGLSHMFSIQNRDEESMEQLFAGGHAVGDYDGDGDVDIFIAAGDSTPSQLFQNNGNNQFEDVATTAGVSIANHKGSGPMFADIDGDGDLDLLIGAIEGHSIYVFSNNGDGTFTDITANTGLNITALNTIGAAFGDIDNDGDLDLALTHWGNTPDATLSQSEHLWLNKGGFQFENISKSAGITDTIYVWNGNGMFGDLDYTFTPNFADINNDGFVDLLITGDFGTSMVFMNLMNGTFENVTDRDIIVDANGMGAAIADADNDGDLDWFVTAIYDKNPSTGLIRSPGNFLYTNQGEGSFSTTPHADQLEYEVHQSGWAWGTCFADFNNDGLLDIYVTNGWEELVGIYNTDTSIDYANDPSTLFMANADGTYTEYAQQAQLEETGLGRGVSCFDSDGDGDVDILTSQNSITSTNGLSLFENLGSSTLGNYLGIKLRQANGNTEALGARVYITTSDGVVQMREVRNENNYVSQNPAQVHFGLGEHDTVSELKIIWPDGREQIQSNVESNQRLVIDY
ncbi:CRTAC1 family protein [Echinimonas agarilytica]|uniref:CRTAC1 family protein n=1 Tax=Echinimonas agarilytica TaxID=1215918 RepID=A0AA41W7P6_9GAMM|nr:CRTAC1 family protein [Echinimonas agarilytica]MCM2680494.1 CRTAC1 family protein [Echinimonas agarilytica]